MRRNRLDLLFSFGLPRFNWQGLSCASDHTCKKSRGGLADEIYVATAEDGVEVSRICVRSRLCGAIFQNRHLDPDDYIHNASSSGIP